MSVSCHELSQKMALKTTKYSFLPPNGKNNAWKCKVCQLNEPSAKRWAALHSFNPQSGNVPDF